MKRDDVEGIRTLEAQQLREAWDRRFPGDRTKRRELADKYRREVAYIGHLFTGYKPISAAWKLRIAAFMEVAPTDVWPHFDLIEEVASELPTHLAQLLRAASSADPAVVDAARTLIEKTQTGQ
jgi:hypothetical protein